MAEKIQKLSQHKGCTGMLHEELCSVQPSTSIYSSQEILRADCKNISQQLLCGSCIVNSLNSQGWWDREGSFTVSQ